MAPLNVPLPTASRTVLADHAYAVLRGAILAGELAAGMALREAEVATRLGVSRTPVRAALHRLEVHGLVERSPKGHMLVGQVNAVVVAEAYDLRILLDGFAARRAAATATAADIAHLTSLVDTAERAVAEGQSEALADLNDRFHGYIASMAGNRILSRTIQSLRDQTPAFRAFALGAPVQQQGFVAEHRDLVAALAAHDAVRAEALATAHQEHAKALLLRQLGSTP